MLYVKHFELPVCLKRASPINCCKISSPGTFCYWVSFSYQKIKLKLFLLFSQALIISTMQLRT